MRWNLKRWLQRSFALVFSTLLTLGFARLSAATPDGESGFDWDPHNPPEALMAEVDQARLVLLGECTHGTHEFYRDRSRFSRYLITNHDFSFIAVEGDWNAIEELDRYVRHHPEAEESARDALLRIERWPLWMWANKDMVQLGEWLREHNRPLAPEDRIGIHGIDVYGLWGSLEALLDYIAAEVPDFLPIAREHYAELIPFKGDNQGYARHAGEYQGDARDGAAAMVDWADGLYQQAADQERKLLLGVLQHARVVQSAEEHLRTSNQVPSRSWNARARHFAETVDLLLDHYGEDSRGIVWAHNTHIGDARATGMHRQGQVNIGLLSRQSYGQKAFLIGFTTARGEFLAARQWEGEMESFSMADPREDSLEAQLEPEFARPTLFLFRSGQRTRLPIFFEPIAQRAIGVVYQPEQEQIQNYPVATPSRRFDALIFQPESSALVPIHPEEFTIAPAPPP